METFLIVVVCIILFWRVFVRWILPALLGRMARKMQQNMADQFAQHQHYADQHKGQEGDVYVDTTKSGKNSSKGSDVGDYVDFEEIE